MSHAGWWRPAAGPVLLIVPFSGRSHGYGVALFEPIRGGVVRCVYLTPPNPGVAGLVGLSGDGLEVVVAGRDYRTEYDSIYRVRVQDDGVSLSRERVLTIAQ